LTGAAFIGTFAPVVDEAVTVSGRVLFVPVSGPRGMGEYARALALATEASRRWPQLEIHFAVSRQAPYAADTPFPMTLLPSSPTFHNPEMAKLISTFRPTLVVFDNAGRTAQLRAAVRTGARVIYVSSRGRQRRRAFRLRWMNMLDEHWIAYPEFIAGGLSTFERLKLKLLDRPTVKYLDVVLPPRNPVLAAETMRRFDVTFGDYVLVVPGGGTDHPGAEHAPQIIAEAARRIAERGVPTVLVGVTPSGHLDKPPPHALHVAPRMPMAQLAELMRGARLVISNGGDTMLQAIAAARPCVAVPIAGDQAHRIARCESRGLAVASHLDPQALSQAALSLLGDSARHAAFVVRLGKSKLGDGLDTALASIARLVRS
jgi:ADP-heptose:LPS heptosyltransferase